MTLKTAITTILLATTSITATNAQAAIKHALDIPAQELGSALVVLARQTHLQVVYSADLVQGHNTLSLSGSMTPDEALDKLLAKTGLRYEFLDEQTVTLSPHAANAAGGGQESSSDSSQGSSDSSQSLIELEEIIVTGTYIRGEAPVGSAIRTYSREEIDKTGASTLEQFARTMTENFSGADLVANSFSSAATYAQTESANLFGGASFNLRGIGTSSTLTLLNGNRLAAGGLAGAMIDISQIPVSVIERIEVMADGASAIYGADAVAGVVNIITKSDFDGAETAASYGAASDGGAEQFIASQVAGTFWSSGNVLLNYEYSKQNDLDASQRDYIPDQGGPYTLIPENRKHNVFVAARQSIGSRTRLSANAIYGVRETFMQSHNENAIYVADSLQSADVKQSGASMALEHQLHNDWTVTATGNYSALRQEIESDQILSLSRIDADSNVLGMDLLAGGTVAQLPAGGLKAAIGISTREEEFETLQTTVAPGFSSVDALPKVSRRVNSAYLELRLPLVGNANSLPWARKVELSGAVRHDDYSDVGSTTNSKFGLNWAPVDGFALRGSYGTSFRAPLLAELRSPTSAFVVPYPDPTVADLVSNTVILSGGNPSLHPEEATSFTAGFDIQPRDANWVVSVTYFDIDFEDRITQPPLSADPFTNPVMQPFLTRNPALADVQAIFQSPGFRGDFSFQGPAGVDVIWDQRRANIATTQESGIDFSTTYQLPTQNGQFSFALALQRLLDNDYQIVDGAPAIELLNRFGQPPKWKGRAGLNWAHGDFQAGLSLNYTNSYRNGLGAGPGTPGSTQMIDSWSTADVYLGYSPQQASGLLRDCRVALSVSNLTDEEPPFAEIPAVLTLPGARVLPFDAANASSLGRLISLRISKQWN